MTRSPSVKDVARLAGVSTATVSRTLNKMDSVSEETKDIVLRAAQEVGYRVNHSARSLRLQRTGAVAVLIPNLGNPFFSKILAGIESVMTESGINVLILDTKGETPRQPYIAEYLTSQRADGIICLDGQLEPDAETTNSKMLNLPVVFACEWPASDDCNVVRADNAKGARLGVEHLVALGHKRIGHVAGPVENVLTRERQQATVEALREHKIKIDESWFFKGDFSLESGTGVAKQWLLLDERPTALFCASDQMAIGVIAELKKHNISVPEDLSIVGFDDIAIAQYYSPTLTTIRQPTRELGVAAATALLARLNGDTNTTFSKLLDVELVERSSTAPL